MTQTLEVECEICHHRMIAYKKDVQTGFAPTRCGKCSSNNANLETIYELEQELASGLAERLDELAHIRRSIDLPTPREIIDTIIDMSDIHEEFILGRQKSRIFTTWRILIYWTMTEYTFLSTKQIGRILNRDHSTVIYGRDRVRMLLETNDQTTLERIDELRDKFGEGATVLKTHQY